jgi:hypothetical protein
MELLLRPITMITPPLDIVRQCNVSLNAHKWKHDFTSGKIVEMSSELFFSKALSFVTSDSNANIVFFDNCPYSSHITAGKSDPYGDARSTLYKLEDSVKSVILSGKGCVYMALHPLSYPSIKKATRYCTALVEDKTLSGNEKDIVIPAGALDYGMRFPVRRCTLSYFGNTRGMSAEFQNIRSRVRNAITKLNATDACIVSGRSYEYIKMISQSKFCFVLPGDTRGGEKLAISIMQGCIPVVDHYSWKVLPFFDMLNYTSFAIRMPKVWNITNLLINLRDINYTEYQLNLAKARLWMDYSRYGRIVSPYTLIWNKVMELWS